MAVEIISNTIFKPSPSVPPHPLLNSLIPLTIFDRAALDLHIPIIYAFRPPMPSNEAIKVGLSKALNIYPHLAGRLTVVDEVGPCFHLNNAGPRLVEAHIRATLAEWGPIDPSMMDLTELYPPIDCADEFLIIQLNRFECGGMVVACSIYHKVADGQSMGSFTHSWSRLVRGLDAGPLPYYDRTAILTPRNPPKCEFDHWAIEFPIEIDTTSSPIVRLVAHFSAQFLAHLKTYVMGQQYSTFECLVAHLWKKITEARRLGKNEFTKVSVAVNGRARMKPAVPAEFFGNFVVSAHPRLSVKDLLNASYELVTNTVHESVAKMDDDYVRSFINYGALSKDEEEGDDLYENLMEMGNSLCPNLEVSSWGRLKFDDVDFGSGRPYAFLPGRLPIEGLVVLVPSCEEKGGLDAHMSLLQEHMAHFRKISHSLE